MKSKSHFTLALALLSTLHPQLSAVFAQGTAFTYQGVLSDQGTPATGIYELRFTVFDALSGGSAVAGPVTNAATSVSNGLFTVTLDFGPGVFSGADRWLQIGVRTNGAAAFVALSPRQMLTATPYAITAGTVTGPINGASVLNGTITEAQLAPGAASSNLLAGGQTGVAGGGIVLSEYPNNDSLVNAGYVRIGKVDLVPEHWTTNAPGPPASGTTADRTDHTAVWTGSEMIIWGGFNGGYRNDGLRYNPATDSWTATSKSGAPSGRRGHSAVNPTSDTWIALPQTNAPTPRSNVGAVWTGTDFIVWAGGDFNGSGGGANQNTGGRYNLASNTWAPTSTNGVPPARNSPDAFWDGTHAIFWGGLSGGSGVSSGGRYDPLTDSWAFTAYIGSWAAQSGHAAAWADGQMLVMGGVDSGGTYQNDNYGCTPPRTTYLYMKP